MNDIATHARSVVRHDNNWGAQRHRRWCGLLSMSSAKPERLSTTPVRWSLVDDLLQPLITLVPVTDLHRDHHLTGR